MTWRELVFQTDSLCCTVTSAFGSDFMFLVRLFASVCAVELQPALHVDILKELNVGESFTGVFPVQGFHNDTTAFLFKGTSFSSSLHDISAMPIYSYTFVL